MALSPTSTNLRSVKAYREVDDTGQLESSPRFVQHTGPYDGAYPGREALTSDLPFRTVQWDQSRDLTSPSQTAGLASPFEGYYQHSPAYAPTPTYTTPNAYYPSTPRYIPSCRAPAVPAYIRSPAVPAFPYPKRRAESCFDDLALPNVKIKKDEDEDEEDTKSTASPPPLTDRRASSPNERHRRRSSQEFESWRKRRKDQKKRLKLDSARYEAEQEALFSVYRKKHGSPSPVPGDGEVGIKQERGEGEVVIKQERYEDE